MFFGFIDAKWTLKNWRRPNSGRYFGVDALRIGFRHISEAVCLMPRCHRWAHPNDVARLKSVKQTAGPNRHSRVRWFLGSRL